MRQDFRIKVDLSRIYQDFRSHSWVYIDSTKLFYVHQLGEHIQQLFDITKPFHLISKYEEVNYFLPFEEDVRILHNNDTVSVMPEAVLTKNCLVKNFEEGSQNYQNDFIKPSTSQEKKGSIDSEKSSFVSEKSSYVTERSALQNKIDGSDTVSLSGSFYKTAIHETVLNDSQDSKAAEENLTEDNSVAEESTGSNKRKRVRKRKSKKSAETLPESDISLVESCGKKPKVIDSILLSSGKHIHFKMDDEDEAFDGNIANDNNVPTYKQNGDVNHKKSANDNLKALLSLRQSSTPITFAHKRIKREFKPEPITEKDISEEISVTSSKSNGYFDSSKAAVEVEKSKENSVMSKCTSDDDTVSFKVFRIGEDYTPQLSNVILAKVLTVDQNESRYTMKILHGKDQLQDPEGKFSLPKDDEEMEEEPNDIITLDKSQLLDFTKVTALGTPK